MNAVRSALAALAALAVLPVLPVLAVLAAVSPTAAAAAPPLSVSLPAQSASPGIPHIPLPSGSSTWTRHGPRSYLLSLPAGFTPGRAYPVIVAFGPRHHSPEQFAANSGLARAAGGDAIVVFARGVTDAWEGAPYAATGRGEDVAYVRDIIAQLSVVGAVDHRRIYAVGMSNGGGMAAALACQAPDLVDGVVAVAGAYYNPTVSGCAGGRVPTMLIHGTADNVVAYNGGWRHGAHYESVPAVFDRVGRRNGCVMEQVHVTDVGANAVRLTPAGCAAATTVVRVNGGGHSWFTGPSAAALSVEFFRSL